jgi:hypothetical protein
VLDEVCELGESGVGVALADVLHCEAVTGEGVGGVGGEDFGESSNLVHELMVRCSGLGWQVCGLGGRTILAGGACCW